MILPNTVTPRLRMFAGPNGSGKSSIKSVIRNEILGVYINPDEIEAEIRKFDFLNLSDFGVETTKSEIINYFQNSTLLKKADLLDEVENLKFNQNRLNFSEIRVNAYFASVAADFVRQKLIVSKQSFAFETVMSSPDKIELLKRAQQSGYRTYLYYVATDDPLINISRVKHRVKMGGHDVPIDKITARYYRSLDLLREAIEHTNRAYIFDNSASQLLWLAEITDGKIFEIKVGVAPSWFKKYVLDKIRL